MTANIIRNDKVVRTIHYKQQQ